MVGASGFFSWLKIEDAVVFGGFDHTELHAACAFGSRDGGDGHFGALLDVVFDHTGDVHEINVISAENRYHVRFRLFHQVDVLENGVGGSLIPGLVLAPHLGGHRNHKLILQERAELPSLTEMLQEGLAAELGQHVDRIDPGVDKRIAQYKVNDSKYFPPNGTAGLARSLVSGARRVPFAAGRVRCPTRVSA